MKKSTILLTIGFILVAVVSFLFIVNIIMLSHVVGASPAEIQELGKQPGLIGYLSSHTTIYGLFIVLPLFLCIIGCPLCLVFGFIKRKREQREEN